jgi:hypothetical protein
MARQLQNTTLMFLVHLLAFTRAINAISQLFLSNVYWISWGTEPNFSHKYKIETHPTPYMFYLNVGYADYVNMLQTHKISIHL